MPINICCENCIKALEMELGKVMELEELIASIFIEAYKLGRNDGLNGIYIKPEAVLDKFMAEQGILKGNVKLLGNVQISKLKEVNDNFH